MERVFGVTVLPHRTIRIHLTALISDKNMDHTTMDPKVQASFQMERCCRLAILISLCVAQVAYYYNLLFLTPTAPIPYHTSILTGKGWMLELINGHPNRIRMCLGVNHKVFDQLVHVLRHHGVLDS